MSKLSWDDRRFLRALAELVAHDLVKKYGEQKVAAVEAGLAGQVEKTVVTCLEAKL